MNKIIKIFHCIAIVLTILLTAVPVAALDASHYASRSRLASGRWARVKVSQTGMHIITEADIRALGFNDISKVNIYGRGGRVLPDGFSKKDPDDLPLIPCVRTQKGLVFFATDHFTWSWIGDGAAIPYSHDIHPYCDDNYYFISDIDPQCDTQPAKAEMRQDLPGDVVNTFQARAVHELELEHAGESGSQIYGEDFRTVKSQTFSFDLPDNADGTADVCTRFAAKTTSGGSSLIFKANGKQLPSTNSDKISSVSSTLIYAATTETLKEVEDAGNKLDLNITFSYSGVLFMARLDYIEVFWNRRLRLHNGELHFYDKWESNSTIQVDGCSKSTRIWDVTDPTSPLEVEYKLEGSTAKFAPINGGYREYVAFDADAVTTKTVNDNLVSNQDLHSLPTPDMVIITHAQYRQGAERIAALHEDYDGMRVHVLEPQEIYNEFSGGKRDVGAFRRLMKMWYDRGEDADGHSIKYCLLMGKPSYDNKMVSAAVKNAGYTPMPIWQSYNGLDEKTSYSTDDYIAMLDDATQAGFEFNRAQLRVAVGRLPVTSSAQAVQMAEKIEKYVLNPDYGSWRNKVMVIADDDDNGVHLTQAEDVYKKMRSNGNGSSYRYDRLYLDSYFRVMTGTGPTYPQATERMLKNYNDGVLLTNYIGHASPHEWGHEQLWTWEKISSMANKNLTFIYAATCGFAYWDVPDVSGAEHLVLNTEGGVIGMIAATRTVYVYQNGVLNNYISPEYFKYDEGGHARRFGDIYISGKNRYSGDTNRLRYAFLGDPAIKIPNPEYNVRVTKINGREISEFDPVSWPELKAGSNVAVEGDIIVMSTGLPVNDFDGTLNLQLYDAEHVVTTNGQGVNGKVINYNDRTIRLGSVNTKVNGGKWSTTLRVPPEITGNYATAQISAYAWTDKGVEANGNCETLFIYGYDETASADTEGPVIEKFYVNSENFRDGDLVNSSPVIFARLSDISGINVSEGGIGHSLSLTVDGKDVYSDLNSYFESDPYDCDAGDLLYPLSELTPGSHVLTLTAWDNANNSSRAELKVNIGAAVDPAIHALYTDVNPASESVTFTLELDRPNTRMNCVISVYDMGGRKVWEYDSTDTTDIGSVLKARWNLCDASGSRVPRGIYLYRATVETPEGTYSSKSNRLAVTAH